MPSFHRALTGAFVLAIAVCCSPQPVSSASAPDRSITARQDELLGLEAQRVIPGRRCGIDPPGGGAANANECEAVRLFHALASFHTGGAGSIARANDYVASTIASLQTAIDGADTIIPAGRVSPAPILFHFQRALLTQRLIRLFGHRGSRALSDGNERQLRQIAARWAATHCRIADADPGRTWRIYLSENHHAQLIASCWAAADLGRDAGAAARYADGSTAAVQYARWTAYARAWLAQRARYGLIEYFSPHYSAYTLETVYAYAQFADDAALRRDATRFLDLWWSSWAQQQIDGVFGGSMTRVYPKAVAEMSPMQVVAWTYTGVGARPVANPAYAAALFSSYRPPVAVLAATVRALPPAPQCTRDTVPGRLSGTRDRDWFTVDPALPAVLRTTCVAQGYVMGSAAETVLPLTAWAGISDQNEMAAIAFAGGPRRRIAIVGSAPDGRSSYNALIAVQDERAMLVKPPSGRGLSKGATGLRVWVGPDLKRSERGGWVFLDGSARAALRPTIGGYRWDGNWLTPADRTAGFAVHVATLRSGTAASFQQMVLRSRVTDSGASAMLTDASGVPLRIDAGPGGMPHLGARAVDFMPRPRTDWTAVAADP